MARTLFLFPIDEAYTWAAIRFVERNPVRAGMVKHAKDYEWSSAAAHCDIETTALLTLPTGNTMTESDWSDWLAIAEQEEATTVLRRHVEKGLPCGAPIKLLYSCSSSQDHCLIRQCHG